MNQSIYKPEGFCTAENECFYTTATIEKAATSGRILEAKATVCDENMSLSLDLGCMRGIIERNEAAYNADGSEIKDIAVITRVGKSVCFKVMGVERLHGEQVAMLSRREAQMECLNNYLLLSSPGDVISAGVTHLEPFGAFVDVGCGIVSLLSIDCISVSRISHPRDRFFPGMFIKTAIKSVDRDMNRISVTHKELLGTWRENADKFQIGQTVPGIVRSIEPYGIFIELTPNLAGLAEYTDGVKVGQNATVYIKNIIPEKMKIKLVLVDSFTSPVEVRPPEYFFTGDHMDSWLYSPDVCPKTVGTVFE
ncbi:MAG: S1 RNA-binding domain-containing protein [Clostridia bacterium]|nr:S1 RNA-binding domain-containing protein [Clostridia bacterium]